MEPKHYENLTNLVGAVHAQNIRAASEPKPTLNPVYFVIPNFPRDVWYGYTEKPESAQLVCFVEQRHKHVNQTFNAQYVADALNEKRIVTGWQMVNEVADSMREAPVD